MIGRVAKQMVQSGASFQMPVSWWFMAIAGTLMVAIFFHIRFALYKNSTMRLSFLFGTKAPLRWARSGFGSL